MRTKFHDRLAMVTDEIAVICQLAGDAIANSTLALSNTSPVPGTIAADLCADVHVRCAAVERRAVGLVALQAPVASELRELVAAIHTTDDLEHVATLVSQLVSLSRLRYPRAVSPSAGSLFARMGRVAADLADQAALVVSSRDGDRAARLWDQEAVLSSYRTQVMDLVNTDWCEGPGAAADAALIAATLEGIGRHLAAIGRWMEFIESGDLSPSRPTAHSPLSWDNMRWAVMK